MTEDSQDTGAAGPESEQGPSRMPRTPGRRRGWGLAASIAGTLAALPVIAFTISGSASAATKFTIVGIGATQLAAQRDADAQANTLCGQDAWTDYGEVFQTVTEGYTDTMTGACV